MSFRTSEQWHWQLRSLLWSTSCKENEGASLEQSCQDDWLHFLVFTQFASLSATALSHNCCRTVNWLPHILRFRVLLKILRSNGRQIRARLCIQLQAVNVLLMNKLGCRLASFCIKRWWMANQTDRNRSFNWLPLGKRREHCLFVGD